MLFLSVACSSNETKQVESPIDISSKEELGIYLEKANQDPQNRQIYKAIWQYYTVSGDPYSLIAHANPICRKAKQEGNTALWIMVGAYIGQAYRTLYQYDSMLHYLNQIKDVAVKEELFLPLTLIYNSLAIYELKSNVDPNKALQYFHNALEVAQKDNNQRSYGLILINISAIYHLRNDPSGLEYAIKAYEIGTSIDDPYVLFYATLNAAQLHYIAKNYEQALHYIEKAVIVAERQTGEGHQQRKMVYSIYASILSATKQDAEALKYFKVALDDKQNNHSYSIMTFLGYGNWLLEQQKYRDAIIILSRGADVAKRKSNFELLPQFYYGLSLCHQGVAQMERALMYHKQYVSARDSLNNLDKEREFNKLAMQYKAAKYEQEIQQNELQYVKQERQITIYIFILVILLLLLGVIYFVLIQKNNMYRKLVSKHQEYIRQTEDLQKRVVQDSKIGHLTEEKSAALFKQIECLLADEHIYRQNDISLAYVAERLATNQWYVSRIINQYTGNSFTNYINSARINEAVSILSDLKDDTPLKVLADYLGYNSISSFYRCFFKEIGVPPSKYRGEVRKMTKHGNA